MQVYQNELTLKKFSYMLLIMYFPLQAGTRIAALHFFYSRAILTCRYLATCICDVPVCPLPPQFISINMDDWILPLVKHWRVKF